MHISVLICTYNRSQALIRCLDSVLAAIKRADYEHIEVIVVNNGSTDDTMTLLQEWGRKAGCRLRVFEEQTRGVSYARNRCLIEAKGDVLISIDDDCVMDEDYLVRALSYYQNDEKPVLRLGQVDLGEAEDWPMTIQTRETVKRWHKRQNDCDYISMGEMCAANMILTREIIEKVGIYDTRFGNPIIPAGEDADYGFRVFNSGFLIEYVPDLRVQHFHGRKDADTVGRLIKGYSIGAGALWAKYHVLHPHIMRKMFGKSQKPAKSRPDVSDDERVLKIRELFKRYKIFYPYGMILYWSLTLRKLVKL